MSNPFHLQYGSSPKGDSSQGLPGFVLVAFACCVCISCFHGRLPANEPNGPSASVSFVNDVMPVLTKAGCNSGVCHAKAVNGQNGFRLSLLGFEPQDDYVHLLKEGRGRRLSMASPESSLILSKASGQVPHRGGVRLNKESTEYETLLRWIRDGAQYDGPTATKLLSIQVLPDRGTLPPKSQQPLTAIAVYADGTQRDVTRLALFESNEKSMAEVSEHGMVQAMELPGRVSIMVRYQGLVSVYSASIPLGAVVDSVPASKGFIDDALFSNLKELGIPPSPICDDATFVRRVALDVAGRLPTTQELDSVVGSTDPNKRDMFVAKLLQSSEYADFFANKWTAMLKNRRDDASDITSNFAFYSWVRDSLLQNKPYDQMVRELLAATGTVQSNPPVAWYKRVKEQKQQLEDVAQLFLGVRMQCAQCHHHPFEKWSQDDYYSFAAFFSQVGRKPTSTRGEDMIFHKRGIATAANIKTGTVLKPAALGTSIDAITADQDPRLYLANWMSDPKNPFFAKAVVNRYWKHFFRRGLIDPEDDIRDTNPPSNPELLAGLEKHFIASGFDLKELVRVIVTSNAYQLSSVPNQSNSADQQNYSRYYLKRLQAEVLLDSIDDVTGARTDFQNLPTGTRAVALPDNSYNNATPFLKVFGRPENESVCECERTQSSSLAQSLHLMNAGDVKAKLATAGGRADLMSKSQQPMPERVTELYRVAFGRSPSAAELTGAVDYLTEASSADGSGVSVGQPASPERFQDLIWALINTKEFLFNH